MSNVAEGAAALWSDLVNALRTDGLIAHCVLQSGPATTALMVALFQRSEQAWLSMQIKPQEDRQVVAQHQQEGLCVIQCLDGQWYDASGRAIDIDRYSGWMFVRMPQ